MREKPKYELHYRGNAADSSDDFKYPVYGLLPAVVVKLGCVEHALRRQSDTHSFRPHIDLAYQYVAHLFKLVIRAIDRHLFTRVIRVEMRQVRKQQAIYFDKAVHIGIVALEDEKE